MVYTHIVLIHKGHMIIIYRTKLQFCFLSPWSKFVSPPQFNMVYIVSQEHLLLLSHAYLLAIQQLAEHTFVDATLFLKDIN